jgi:hypothetical protein
MTTKQELLDMANWLDDAAAIEDGVIERSAAALREYAATMDAEPAATVIKRIKNDGTATITVELYADVSLAPGTQLFSHPPAQQRKPLTDDEIDDLIQIHVDPVATYRKLHTFARATLAAQEAKK